MRILTRLEIVLLSGLIIVGAGCGSKQPATKGDKAPDSGPVLAPPQQPSPDTKQGAQSAFPTEGDPDAKASAGADKTVKTGATGFPTEGDPTGKTPHGAPPPAGETAEEAKIKANLVSLSAEDRSIVEYQKICPVSGEALGEMGPPKKIKVAGQEVFICCASCEEPITKEPAKYLAKIGLKPAQ
jgi:hypothetical protein